MGLSLVDSRDKDYRMKLADNKVFVQCFHIDKRTFLAMKCQTI